MVVCVVVCVFSAEVEVFALCCDCDVGALLVPVTEREEEQEWSDILYVFLFSSPCLPPCLPGRTMPPELGQNVAYIIKRF